MLSVHPSVCLCLSVCVCLSVTLVDHYHIAWKSWKLIAWTISPISSLLIARRSSTYSQGNMEKFWGENVHSTTTSITPMTITSRWIESTESHMILGGGVAVCCLFSFAAHCMVIFSIVQLSCTFTVLPFWCRLTRVVPDKIQEGCKWWCVCACARVRVCYSSYFILSLHAQTALES